MSAAGPPRGANCAPSGGSAAAELIDEAASVGVQTPSAAGPPRGANCAPSGGSAAAELIDEAASVGVQIPSAAGPPRGANCAPSGGSAAAELIDEAASVGIQTSSDIVRVAAAVIVRADGRVLLAQRPPGKAYAGYWEFPGGKLEPGESAAAALGRELQEELGITVTHAVPWMVQEFVYPHAHVELHFFRVLAWTGEPFGHDGQSFAWQLPGAFDVTPMLPANTRVMAALALPSIYGVSCAEEIGEEEFLIRAAGACQAGLRLIQMREKNWSPARRDAFAKRLLPIASRFDARVLLNGAVDDARSGGFAGVHWTAAALAQASSRPRDLIVGASCHTREELARAAELDVDFAVLGPVQPTPTHSSMRPLEWDGFAQCIERTRVPVYAIGGLTPQDLATAIDRGAHGIALRRFAWPRL